MVYDFFFDTDRLFAKTYNAHETKGQLEGS